MRDTVRPAPSRDLDDATEIAEMVRRFYADVAQDDLLGPMFNDVARVDWSEHLPKLEAYWRRALLSEPGYSGNPYRSHIRVHEQQPFTAEHFERWLALFHETVELGWVGPCADRALDFADKVARVHSQQIIGRAVSLDPSGAGDELTIAFQPRTIRDGARIAAARRMEHVS
jgi:hemoglobin